MKEKSFAIADFTQLQKELQNGEITCLFAVSREGKVTAYARDPGEDVRPHTEQKTTTAVRSVATISSGYYCDPTTHTWWFCYIDTGGNEHCIDTGIPC